MGKGVDAVSTPPPPIRPPDGGILGHSVAGVLAGWIRGDATLHMVISTAPAHCPASEGKKKATDRGEAVPAPPAIGVLGTKTGAARFADRVEGVLVSGGGTASDGG